MSYVSDSLAQFLTDAVMGNFPGTLSVTLFKKNGAGDIFPDYTTADVGFTKLATVDIGRPSDGSVSTYTGTAVADGQVSCAIVHATSDTLAGNGSTSFRAAINGTLDINSDFGMSPGMYVGVSEGNLVNGGSVSVDFKSTLVGAGIPQTTVEYNGWYHDIIATDLGALILDGTDHRFTAYTTGLQTVFTAEVAKGGLTTMRTPGGLVLHRGANLDSFLCEGVVVTAVQQRNIRRIDFRFNWNGQPYQLTLSRLDDLGHYSGGLTALSSVYDTLKVGDTVRVPVLGLSTQHGDMPISDFDTWTGGDGGGGGSFEA